MKRVLLLPVLLAAGCSDPPATATITFRGKEVVVEWARAETRRRTAPRDRLRMVDSRGLLVGYTHDRHHHYFSTGSEGGFDVLFLAADGRVLERQRLPENNKEGVTSKGEARYALFLAEGWCARHNVGENERVELSSGITSYAPEPLPEVTIGGTPLRVEVAATLGEQRRGLMHRRALSAEDGMIFAYDGEKERSFWMGNCHIGLDIAYFDAQGAFINLVPMDAYPDPKVEEGPKAPSDRPAQYVIEANKGWFRRKGLVGDDGQSTRELRLEIPEPVREIARKAR